VFRNVINNLSIKNGRWKLIAAGKGPAINIPTNTETGNLNQDQLFDLAKDKGEKINVIDKHTEAAGRLKEKLDQIKARK
jgi:hypothetical protein